ncbi:hypothetical protein [Streptomyces griseorubiginosus]|uniref:hypothetical protein n=1 Tax=Streptomyces griseorubiginosus TaxID=67304 RepID=UPI00365AFF53
MAACGVAGRAEPGEAARGVGQVGRRVFGRRAGQGFTSAFGGLGDLVGAADVLPPVLCLGEVLGGPRRLGGASNTPRAGASSAEAAGADLSPRIVDSAGSAMAQAACGASSASRNAASAAAILVLTSTSVVPLAAAVAVAKWSWTRERRPWAKPTCPWRRARSTLICFASGWACAGVA